MIKAPLYVVCLELVNCNELPLLKFYGFQFATIFQTEKIGEIKAAQLSDMSRYPLNDNSYEG